jgi:hypothetical protein
MYRNRGSLRFFISLLFIVIIGTTFGIIETIIFSNWKASAQGYVDRLASETNYNILENIEDSLKIPVYVNAVNYRFIAGINQSIRISILLSLFALLIAISTAQDMSDIADFILAHHERWDDKGYPRGLKGAEIPRQSRIIAIADTFDAMTNQRSYRPTMTETNAILELEKNAGTQFDPGLVKVFVKLIMEKGSN